MVYLQETGKLKSIFFTIVWFVDVSKTAIDAGVDLSIVQVDVNFWMPKGSTTSITSNLKIKKMFKPSETKSMQNKNNYVVRNTGCARSRNT